VGANESKLSEFRRDPISLPKGFETRSAPALLTASTLVAFTLITHTASCLRQLPSCVAVYPRDSRSRLVLCRSTPFAPFSVFFVFFVVKSDCLHRPIEEESVNTLYAQSNQKTVP